jgi:hypothetical protein
MRLSTRIGAGAAAFFLAPSPAGAERSVPAGV